MTVTKGVGRSRMTPDKLRGFARFEFGESG